MSDFGYCETCEQPAVVGLNGRKYCQVHFEAALAKLAATLRPLTKPAP